MVSCLAAIGAYLAARRVVLPGEGVGGRAADGGVGTEPTSGSGCTSGDTSGHTSGFVVVLVLWALGGLTCSRSHGNHQSCRNCRSHQSCRGQKGHRPRRRPCRHQGEPLVNSQVEVVFASFPPLRSFRARNASTSPNVLSRKKILHNVPLKNP